MAIIPAMSQQESFTVEVGGGHIEGTLALPEGADARRFPTVLICRGLHTFDDETAELLHEAAEAFRESGLATVDYEARSAKMILDDFHAYTASDNLDDAIAVLDWMLGRSSVDAGAIGLLGYNIGGITAACLAGRTDRITRLALLSPGGAERSDDDAAPAVPEGYLDSLTDLKPLESLMRQECPTMVMHGAADRDIDPDASFEYRRAFETAGRPIDHLQVALADHTFSWSEARLACIEQLCRFFAEMKS